MYQRSKKVKTFISILIISGVFCYYQNSYSEIFANTKNQSSKYYAHMLGRHAKILKHWLIDKRWFVPATEENIFDKQTVKMIRAEEYSNFYPYYVSGDFNRDGVEDFAVILRDLRSKTPDKFAVAIFNGPFNQAKPPVYFEQGYDYLGNSFLDFNRTVKDHLYLGVYESDYFCVTFIPNKQGYKFEDCNH